MKLDAHHWEKKEEEEEEEDLEEEEEEEEEEEDVGSYNKHECFFNFLFARLSCYRLV